MLEEQGGKNTGEAASKCIVRQKKFSKILELITKAGKQLKKTYQREPAGIALHLYA